MGEWDRQRASMFAVSGEAALAWSYVMCHWPDRATTPELRDGPGPMQIVFGSDPKILYILRRTLMLARTCSGSLGQSAETLLGQLNDVLPCELPPTRTGSQAE
jgi:hypothetical protein